jgi:type I restriction enzyme R subunit
MQYLNEASLEALIVKQMVEGGWAEGSPADFVPSYAIDLGNLTAFIEATQPALIEPLGLAGDSPTRHKFLARVQGEITKRGVVHLLRNGVDHLGHHGSPGR